FSRVTGGSVSYIDGLIETINTNNSVSLFLMNPNGIIFGQNARLNISGSFVGTTAQSIQFADGTEFSTVNGSTPLLTMSVPIGLQIGQNPGAITVKGLGHLLNPARSFAPLRESGQRTGLQVQSGKSLALVGGNVLLEGGLLTALQGRVELGAVDTGTIGLNGNSQGWSLDYGKISQFRNLNLYQQSLVDVSGTQAGNIQIQASQLNVKDGSVILSQNLGSLPSGNISIKTTESLQVLGESSRGVSSVSTENLGLGKAGDIQITTPQLQMAGGATIATRGFGAGRTGDVTINASTLNLDGTSKASPTQRTSIFTVTNSVGLGGDLNVVADQIQLTSGAFISSSTFGKGTGGSVFINAKDSVYILGFDPVVTSPSVIGTATYSSGTSGDLNLVTPRLSIQGGGRVDASTYASGKAGNIEIQATDFIEVTGGDLKVNNPSVITASAFLLNPILRRVLRLPDMPTGDAANINIQTSNLIVTDDGIINVRNDGSGQAGNVKIQSDRISLNRHGSILATTKSGQGGEIFLTADNLILKNGSLIATTARELGNGGNIRIDAPIILGIGNSDIVANATQGYGGNIEIVTQGIFGLQIRPVLTPDNDITASSELGVNGNVQINNIDVDPSSGLVVLPANITDSSQQIATGCSVTQGSSFVATGRGGVPQNPTQQIISDRTWSDIRDISAYRKSNTVTAQIQLPSTLVEATSWYRNAQGKVEFITNQPHVNVRTQLACSQISQN
ncbi:S-layer family protein, partial [Nostoc sp. NIES-2111]